MIIVSIEVIEGLRLQMARLLTPPTSSLRNRSAWRYKTSLCFSFKSSKLDLMASKIFAYWLHIINNSNIFLFDKYDNNDN